MWFTPSALGHDHLPVVHCGQNEVPVLDVDHESFAQNGFSPLLRQVRIATIRCDGRHLEHSRTLLVQINCEASRGLLSTE